MNGKPKRLLESCLPADFLADLGLYLQTCAHIEIMTCALVCELESIEIHSPNWKKRHVALRKMRPAELFKALKNSSKRLPAASADQATQIAELVDWMENYIQNRHIAAHGGFFRANDCIRVNYWHLSDKNQPNSARIEDTVITPELVGTLIDDADRILRSLWRMVQFANELHLHGSLTHPSSTPR